tara:strand:+ start:21039 stop:23759 length:2721 start_codon:yes stop_codon:yes gene_type:complete
MNSKKYIVDTILENDEIEIEDIIMETELDDNTIDNSTDSETDIIVGIDLGTSNSCISIWRNNNLEIIPDENGNRTIPSVVSYTNLSKYVGKEAKNQLDINPENTFYEIKRLIGRKFSDISVQKDLPFLSYEVMGTDNDNVIVKTDLERRKPKHTPEEISAQVLMKLKHMAEIYLKCPIKKAVITVPAYFNDGQRQATKDAAIIAGLEPVRIINEPTAAALAYGFQNQSIFKDGSDMNIIVYDIGGGTTDVSLLNIYDGVFEVRASAGNSHLGGADFDSSLITYCKKYFKKKNSIKTLDNISVLSLQKLRKQCENAKKWLTTNDRATIVVQNFYNEKDLFVPITREKFDLICRDLYILCMKSIRDVMEVTDTKVEDIDEIILVGGATRMPTIQKNLRNYFRGKNPNCNVNPDEVVSAGAAIKAYILSNGKDPFSENVVLLDVLPLSLGVETIGGVMNTIIPRNTTIPTRKRRKYTTDSDNETSVTVKIYEGERTLTKNNFYVGQFDLSGLEPEPRGIAEIEVEFSVDVNGIIKVQAKDLKNDQNKSAITVTGNKGRLSQEEINDLLLEAQNMELKDKAERNKKQMYYEIENLCSIIKTNLTKESFNLKKEDKEIISVDIDKIIEWLKEKTYDMRDKNEYDRILKMMKKRYSTLMLKTLDNNSKFKGIGNGNIEATNVFDDSDDELDEKIFEKIEDDELGLCDNTEEEEKKRIKTKRKYLLDLCHSVYDVVSSDRLKVSEEDLSDLKNLINDILLWIHVKEKIKEAEYDEKAEVLNEACDNVVSSYDKIFEENSLKQYEENTKDDLEQLCIALKTSISNNIISCEDDDKLGKLNTLVDENLEYLIDIEVNKIDITKEMIKERIDTINSVCDDIYSSITNIDIKEELNINEFVESNENGTNIFDLIQKN